MIDRTNYHRIIRAIVADSDSVELSDGTHAITYGYDDEGDRHADVAMTLPGDLMAVVEGDTFAELTSVRMYVGTASLAAMNLPKPEPEMPAELASMGNHDVRDLAETVIGDDRVPADVLRALVRDFGDGAIIAD